MVFDPRDMIKELSVILPYRPDTPEREEILSWLLCRYQIMLPDAEIVVADDPLRTVEFNRARARNYGAGLATRDLLYFVDADTMFFVPNLYRAVQMAVLAETYVYPYNVYFNATEAYTNWILQRTPAWIPREDEIDYDHRLTESPAGNLVISRAAFETVGGWDERFECWGFEDNAFRVYADVLWGPHSRVPGFTVHLYHPPGPRFESEGIEANRKLFARYQAAAPSEEAMREVRFG